MGGEQPRRIQWTFDQDEGHVVLVARYSRRVISRSKENGGTTTTPESGRSSLGRERIDFSLSPLPSLLPLSFYLSYSILETEIKAA